jgi:N-acetyl-gamma-glutamyl-phosphate reductase
LIAGIIGATGYAGAELTRLLSRHPDITGLSLSSVSFEGEEIQDVYPSFLGRVSGRLLKAEEVIEASGVVFSALPHAVGEHFAAACTEKRIPFIDLSADFRFDDDEETYKTWYGKPYQYPQLHKNSIYGLPELNRQKIKDKKPLIIANPGCYPTSASLGIFPSLQKDKSLYSGSSPIIVNAVSGISGGGREPSPAFHYSECADSIAPYKIASHRHSPEIERNLAMMAGSGLKSFQLIFTPHLVPMNRGILSTIYIPLSREWHLTSGSSLEEKESEARRLYKDFYKEEPFVRVLPAGLYAATNRVRQSNYCDISVHIDINGSTLIIVSAIDNMVKGAAGQAIQNMNILFGFKETAGLEAIPILF